jgi:hypothetical protein
LGDLFAQTLVAVDVKQHAGGGVGNPLSVVVGRIIGLDLDRDPEGLRAGSLAAMRAASLKQCWRCRSFVHAT